LIGSTCSATSTTVSNKVLNSVVTDVASITSLGEMRCGVGSFGDVKDMYLLPNTVVAVMSALTFFGIRWRYLRSTFSVIFALGWPPTSTWSTAPTLPISTPLYVTLAPGSIDKPLRAAIIVRLSRSRKVPRNWRNTNTVATTTIIARTKPANLKGGLRDLFTGAVIGYTVKLKLGSTP
jgi:hypothetical protein